MTNFSKMKTYSSFQFPLGSPVAFLEPISVTLQGQEREREGERRGREEEREREREGEGGRERMSD